jgi:16S rRNA (cytosine1402-N4)-methyltransferase
MDDHVPVLFDEIMALLQPRPSGKYVDGTVGAGGHTTGLLQRSGPDGQVLALDRDPEAIRFARERLAPFGDRVVLVNASYADMAHQASRYNFAEVNGILLDLGLSSRQLADAGRGFSFMHDGPLDMRFDPEQGQTAADLINRLPEASLAELLSRYGEVAASRKLARAIVGARPLRTTHQLAGLIVSQVGRRGRVHPATQVFQALRIAVNDELETLEQALPDAVDLLAPGGRLAVISFHSLEDRLVKRFFREQARDCVCPPQQPVCTCAARAAVRLVTRKAVKPGEAEVAQNPRSRSARLRVVEKLTVVA